MQGTKYIIGNWKENPDKIEIAEELINISEKFQNKETEGNFHIAISHAVPALFAGFLMKDENNSGKIILQDISCFEGGSYTGEISAKQAKNLGILMSIVGHSETRLSPKNPKGDEDTQVNIKIQNLLKENIWACLCIGEFKRKDLDYKEYIHNQIKNCLKDIPLTSKILLAYEPIWAIGKDAERAATNEEIVDTISFIKTILPNNKVLYGGSVDETNAREILNLEVVDGLLVGRASSDPIKWEKLLSSLT